MSAPRRSLQQLADEPLDERDGATLARVNQLYRQLDPVPAGLVDRISFGITLESLQAEIAELQRDGQLVGSRADAETPARTVTFTSSRFSIMVSVTPTTAEQIRVDGWISPATAVPVDARTASGTLTVDADEDGRFVFEALPRGLVQFTIRPGQETAIVTPSVDL